MVFPVYVPTKGRHAKPTTLRLLAEAGIVATAMVEPQEVHLYRPVLEAMGHRIHVLLKSGAGLPWARNEVLDLARGSEDGWFWQLDDDVTAFYRVFQKKCLQAGAHEVLEGAERLIEAAGPGVGQAALEYQQFAWSSEKGYSADSYCDVAVAIHAQRTRGLRYRAHLALKEDRDFTLQVLQSGLHTYRCQRFAFAAPKNGSNEGGLHADYKAGRERAQSEAMVHAWPGICQLNVKPDGRPDVKINWRKARPAAPAPAAKVLKLGDPHQRRIDKALGRPTRGAP